MQRDSEAIVRAYYDAFNRSDEAGFLSLLADQVVHDVNQGERQVGKAAFARFLAHMNECYRERIADLVVLTEPSGTRAAAEFTVHGTYVRTDEGLPPASGQTYVLSAGAFFALQDGMVSRISNFYNLQEWLAQIRT